MRAPSRTMVGQENPSGGKAIAGCGRTALICQVPSWRSKIQVEFPSAFWLPMTAVLPSSERAVSIPNHCWNTGCGEWIVCASVHCDPDRVYAYTRPVLGRSPSSQSELPTNIVLPSPERLSRRGPIVYAQSVFGDG